MLFITNIGSNHVSLVRLHVLYTQYPRQLYGKNGKFVHLQFVICNKRRKEKLVLVAYGFKGREGLHSAMYQVDADAGIESTDLE